MLKRELNLTQRPIAGKSQPLDEILEELDREIHDDACRKVPHYVVPLKLVHDEIDELAQDTRIKLWLAMCKGEIANPRAYARRITCNASIDVVRRYRKNPLLLVDDYGELAQSEFTAAADWGVQDPAIVYEQKESAEAFVEIIVRGLLTLPPRQQFGILCNLKNTVAVHQQFVETLAKHGLDLEAVHWPEDRAELQKLRASCSVAKRKLRAYLKREGAGTSTHS
jgi:DNA-directed RNA polymerase specialized sigma24 family protein